MTDNPYSSFSLVDTTIGNRLTLGFVAGTAALQRRLPQPWQIAPFPLSYLSAIGIDVQKLPAQANAVLVFNDILLNLDAQGQPLADATTRYVGFNIPAANPHTGEQGIIHTRIFTGHPRGIPGRYRDALLARVQHEYHLIGEGTNATISEHYQIEPQTGGILDVRLTYGRGRLIRISGEHPNFPVWAAEDPRILRVYQEDSVLEVIRTDILGINHVQTLSFQMTIPELVDVFDGSERLVTIMANPHYSRKVFSPTRFE